MTRCKFGKRCLLLSLVSILAFFSRGEVVAGPDPTLYEAEIAPEVSVHEAAFEPEVRVQEHPNRVEEEYRVNNNLYMIKVTPNAGKPYYLVDEDGSGDMEMRRNAVGMDNRVPQWSLFSW